VCLSEFDKEEIRNYISAVGMYSAVDFTSNCVSFIVCILCVFIIPIFTRESADSIAANILVYLFWGNRESYRVHG